MWYRPHRFRPCPVRSKAPGIPARTGRHRRAPHRHTAAPPTPGAHVEGIHYPSHGSGPPGDEHHRSPRTAGPR
ncbi:hypothetical protein ACFFX0_30105 [Citricoccus parietis]|uniref:Uncharacterized protein n=1 Tax=Citricoccus parietis TaxID=592307 RepID=A0ABV5FVX6_9MICC